MLYIVIGILLFGLLIAVHELGHFLTAKGLDVQVNEFSIGMGPALWKRQRGETLYSLRVLPIGGYCAMEGEDETSENPRAFSAKAPWKKLLILAAGPAANFLAGFLLVLCLFTAMGGYAVPVVRDFMDGFPCEGEDGLLVGDRIVEIEGEKISIYADVAPALRAAGEGPKDVVVERDGQRVVLPGLPLDLQDYEVGGKTVAMYGLYFDREAVSPLGVLRQSWHTCLYFAQAVWSGLAMLVSGQVGLDDMSGPVGIVSYLGEAGSQSSTVAGGVQNVCYLMGLVAVNLAVMNLLPIPALDGGRIFFLLLSEGWWFLTRRPLNPKYEAYLHAGGFVLLMLLMVVVTFSDILKLVE